TVRPTSVDASCAVSSEHGSMLGRATVVVGTSGMVGVSVVGAPDRLDDPEQAASTSTATTAADRRCKVLPPVMPTRAYRAPSSHGAAGPGPGQVPLASVSWSAS